MFLFQLVYVSKRPPELTIEVLQQIVRHSAQANRARGITGMLMCQGTHIMQLLEGEEETIKALFNRIEGDRRHTEVQQLLLKPVKKRLFPEWGMGIVDVDAEASLNRRRLQSLIADIAGRNDTTGLTVEARLLLSDFALQVSDVPA